MSENGKGETLVPVDDRESGLCPHCERNDGCIIIGREQLVCFCLWCAGKNLLTVPLRPSKTKWDAIVRVIKAGAVVEQAFESFSSSVSVKADRT